jgi:hypothetical protein
MAIVRIWNVMIGSLSAFYLELICLIISGLDRITTQTPQADSLRMHQLPQI